MNPPSTPKVKLARPVNPNAGVQAEYRQRLDKLIREMRDSVDYWIKLDYRRNESRIIAEDASPANELRRRMNELSKRWLKQFNQGAKKLAEWFADESLKSSDAALKKILRDAGVSVKFTMTEGMTDAWDAIRNENVQLIRSIGAQYLSDVEGLVQRSVTQGRDMGELTKQLTKRYGVTKDRAALIARDQNNKATSALTKRRQQDLGIKQGKWRHSHAGKQPRQSHVDADGKIFDIDKGMYIDGEWIMPGEKINCRCTWAPVIPGLEDM